VLVGREHAHVGADLGDQHLGGAALDAGDRAQQLNRRLERVNLLLDPTGQRVDVLLEFLDVREHPLEQEGVVLGEAVGERLAQLRQLLAQLALGQLGERLGIRLALDQRAHHRPAGDAHHVGRDAGELHAGVLEQLV